MLPEALAEAITADRAAGLRPIAVVATIGTTSSTSVDPVAEIAEIAERERLWLHVDAAYAGVVAMLPDRRAPFEGWERADSIVVNPHKWLFTPLDASLLLTRRMPQLRAAFSLVPEYLRTLDRDAPVRDYNEYTPQLGRRFRALKLWILLRWFGLDGLRRRIERHLELAADLAAAVEADPDWEVPGARPVLHRLLPLAARSARRQSVPGSRDRRAARRGERRDHGCRQPDRRDLPVAYPVGRQVHDPGGRRQPANRSAPRRPSMGVAPSGRGRSARRLVMRR